MPRLSLYRPEKGNDYDFIDKQIYEMFSIGGTDFLIHKYIGTDDGTTVKDETQIQDLMFLENRDRKYDPDIYTIRGVYNVQDIDFDLSQFGLFLSNDTLFVTIHINSSVKSLGRKIMPGDVIELPHLKDEFAANDFSTALKRFYVVEDVNRAAEGFSPTWYPHLYRCKLKQIVDTQEFADILERPENDDSFEGDYDPTLTYAVGQVVKYQGDLYEVTVETTGNLPTDTNYWKLFEENTLRDLLSTYEKEMQINDAVISEAEAETAKSGYDTAHFYTLAVNENGEPELQSVDKTTIDVSSTGIFTDDVDGKPDRVGYDGYLIGDNNAPNGALFGSGIQFPPANQDGDYFLRTDFLPNRLFKFDGNRWIKVHDVVRHELSNTDTRQTQKTSFINNTNSDVIGGETVEERQSLSKALRPKADN